MAQPPPGVDEPVMPLARRHPLLAAAVIQIVALLGAPALLAGLRAVFPLDVSVGGAADPAPSLSLPLLIATALAQAAIAAGLTRLAGLPVWWIWIGGGFPVAIWLTLLTAGTLPAWPFGLAFLLLYLVFSNTARERVPLYLTNRATAEALTTLMRERGLVSALDLGSGLGDVVRALHGEGRTARGVETAPFAFALSWLLSRLTGRGSIARVSLWETDLGTTDLVYAFLSPEPMPALFAKARAEMKPGSLFVSNSFAVPEVEPDEVWELQDRRGTRLYLYGMGGGQGSDDASLNAANLPA
ncbi:hypothetical protein SAMN05880582_101696 [Rhizobium sp. RU20A]|uniref:hypothetical protein n=1 Tax=Rhizobium sp. RU20A TaxID=1907412 RepID=UPI000955BCA1|nr:hypothetical protein [Rhizobium sp. RU20A]SIQ09270.1 hypothetical protein SAMN05880582_101696 [Rhizobium sp. RU20A]